MIPSRFTANYRRYIERQIREGLGFEGSPLRLFWRGKSERQSQRGLAAAVESAPAQQDGDVNGDGESPL